MKRAFSAGGIVFKKEGNSTRFLLVRNQSMKDPTIDYWGFPKGHIEGKESSKEAALREVFEETGVKAEILDKIGDSRYVYTSPKEQEKVFKIVTIFLMRYLGGDFKKQAEEILEVGWFPADEALAKLSFSTDKGHFKKALEMKGVSS